MKKTSRTFIVSALLLVGLMFFACSNSMTNKNENCKTNSQETSYIIVTNHTNVCLRSSANESSKLTGQNNPKFNEGDRFELLGEEGEYYKVKYNNGTYYFPKKYAEVENCSNSEVQKTGEPAPSPVVSPNEAPWLNKVKEMANWYSKNFTGYQKFLSGKKCPLINKGVRDDCSGLATACLQYYGLYTGNKIFNSAHFRNKNSEIGKILQKEFTPIEGKFMQTDYAKFQPGDILAGYMFENGKTQTAHGHVTIYAGNGLFYDYGGWAYKAKKQPVSGDESVGHMHDHVYTIIWRKK